MLSDEQRSATVQFSLQFTLFISFWNQAEATARRILQLLLGESETAMGLAVEMQNRSLINALRCAARDPQFIHIRDHLEYLIKGYELLLEHRNYHAHSLLGVSADGGILLSVSAKGRLKVDRATFAAQEMEALRDSVSAWIGYAALLEKDLGADGDGLTALIEAYSGNSDRPTWPQKLAKAAVFLQVA